VVGAPAQQRLPGHVACLRHQSPDDPAEAAKLVWDAYYGNHQKKGAFKHLKVADIFMGGGTTVVEGSRLGMQMFGNDLNPVAWFIVKNELAQVDKAEVEALLADIEAEVKPQIMPFYACDCPRGHKGKWTRVSTGEVMGEGFDPLALTPEERKDYSYYGPEIIYAFWAKHRPCQVTGCGHRTPIMSSPVMAIKTLTVKAWPRTCKQCGGSYDIEERDARMAPGVSLMVGETERPFAVAQLDAKGLPESAVCPCCGQTEHLGTIGKGQRKKVELSLLVHPEWLFGQPAIGEAKDVSGGRIGDRAIDTKNWVLSRNERLRLLEVRGKLPEQIRCPGTDTIVATTHGTITKKAHFRCGACGTEASIVKSLHLSNRSAPVTSYAAQIYCPVCDNGGELYGGRSFVTPDPRSEVAAAFEWETRKAGDLATLWPTTEIADGLETSVRTPLRKYGYQYRSDFFNHRQLLSHSQILRAIQRLRETKYDTNAADVVLGAFQLFLRNQCMFAIWDKGYDKTAPFLSKNNLHPHATVVEVGTYAPVGRGSWLSTTKPLVSAADWKAKPREVVSKHFLPSAISQNAGSSIGFKVSTGDPITHPGELLCGSSTDLSCWKSGSFDCAVTDPPFGDIMQYAELSGFFYGWISLALRERLPELFAAEQPPTALEAVENAKRHGKSSGDFYARALTACWREAARCLKPSGILAFTFHHDKDGPWVSVLESLFNAGFYLQAAYPIRSDETKGEGSKPGTFGAQKVEYDIIHVCRKRHETPRPISWAKLRRQVLSDVRALQDLLEHHQQEGLPEADLQVIRRGKALEYFSRHYGKVYKDQDTPMTVLEALLGINQLLDEAAGGIKEAPPHNAEPFTRMLLRLFDGRDSSRATRCRSSCAALAVRRPILLIAAGSTRRRRSSISLRRWTWPAPGSASIVRVCRATTTRRCSWSAPASKAAASTSTTRSAIQTSVRTRPLAPSWAGSGPTGPTPQPGMPRPSPTSSTAPGRRRTKPRSSSSNCSRSWVLPPDEAQSALHVGGCHWARCRLPP
jgi:putative DNA methylase